MQEGLADTPVGGTLRPPRADDDLVSVVVTSAAGSKVDFFQERDVSYVVALDDDGSADAVLDLTLRNHAPTSGEPPYVIGPFPQSGAYFGPILRTIEAGESVALTTVYCGTDCVPAENESELDGSPIDVQFGVDFGQRYVRHYYAVPSGDAQALHLTWDDPAGWEGNSSGGVFRMTFANQARDPRRAARRDADHVGDGSAYGARWCCRLQRGGRATPRRPGRVRTVTSGQAVAQHPSVPQCPGLRPLI